MENNLLMDGKTTERKEWIDIFRGLGIILMIVGHCGESEFLKKCIYGFHMPLFFVLSGYLFNEDKWEKNSDIKNYIRYKWKTYMIPYYVLCACNLIATLGIEFLAQVRGKNLIYSAGKHIFYIIYSFGDASKMPNCSPLWFLPCLFIGDIYLYVFLRLKKTEKIISLLLGGGVISFLTLKNVTQLPWHFDIAFIAMIFMYVGYLLKQKRVLEKLHVLMAIVIGIWGGIFIILNSRVDMVWRQFGNFVYFFCGSICVVISLMFIVSKVEKGKFLSWIGKNSIFFMAFNLLINTCIKILVNNLTFFRGFDCRWWQNVIINIVAISTFVVIWNKLKTKIWIYRKYVNDIYKL